MLSDQTLRLAVYQMSSTRRSIKEALALVDQICVRAKADGAHLVVFPEMALTGYNIGKETVRRLAETCDGAMVHALKEIARRNHIGLVCGFPELAGARIFNSCVLIDAQGEVLSTCRKAQLFGDVDRAQFDAADQQCPVVTFQGWNVGLGICYDVEFPEFVRALSLSGAEVILAPTANMHPFTSVATRIVPARAEENGVYLAYANRVGSEGAFDYMGLSCLVGPDGVDLARAKDAEELIFADISKAHLTEVRNTSPYLQDLRRDLYSLQ